MGIIDDYGLESIYKASDMKLKDFTFYTFFQDLRSKANYQRDATFYFLKLNKDVYLNVMNKVKDSDFIIARKLIEKFIDNEPK